MKTITDYILSKTNRLTIIPEPTPGDHNFSAFNDAGTEQEVSEFLYSLIRVIKPNYILETGCHLGVSSLYMGLALKENNKGRCFTCEILPEHVESSKKLWKDLDVDDKIHCFKEESLKLKFDDDVMFDFAFFDSEPNLRFDEVLYFWNKIKPGSIFGIHDLHSDLGLHYASWEGMKYFSWPYGDYRKKLGDLIKNHEVQVFSMPSPRGFTLFQKRADNFEFSNLLLGKSMSG